MHWSMRELNCIPCEHSVFWYFTTVWIRTLWNFTKACTRTFSNFVLTSCHPVISISGKQLLLKPVSGPSEILSWQAVILSYQCLESSFYWSLYPDLQKFCLDKLSSCHINIWKAAFTEACIRTFGNFVLISCHPVISTSEGLFWSKYSPGPFQL